MDITIEVDAADAATLEAMCQTAGVEDYSALVHQFVEDYRGSEEPDPATSKECDAACEQAIAQRAAEDIARRFLYR